MIRLIAIAVYLVVISSFTEAAYGNVISFDDLGKGLVPSGHAGLTWGTSTWSKPYADSTSFHVNSDQTYAIPQSAPNYVLNGYGVPDLWFEFPAPVNFKGAWFASPTNKTWAAQKVRLVDDLGRASVWLELTDSPQYLEADFDGSRRIYVQPHGVYLGTEADGGWYTLDDITYESIPAPIQHSFSIDITGTGSGSVNSDPSGLIACSYSPQVGVCASAQPHHSSLTLIATPGIGSRLASWSGACSSCVGLFCAVTLDSDQSCSARFEMLPIVRSAGPAFHPSITSAYAQLPEGALSTIQVQAGQLSENLQLDRNVPITVIGGYNHDFSNRSGEYTVLLGAITINQGALRVDRVILR
jgi:hypothetical protein